MLLPVLAALCFSRRRRRDRSRVATRVSINPAIFGNLLDDTFDKQLEKTLNKGVKRDRRSANLVQQVPKVLLRHDFENLVNQRLENKQRRYRAILNAARTILQMNGVQYQPKGSEFQKNLQALMQELIEPKV